MLYAKVVVGLSVSGPFDYIVEGALAQKIKIGARVWVSFGPRRLVGYVVGLSNKSSIKNIKPILELIDDFPILNKKILTLTKNLSDYYCCSWGEAIETALPEGLRKGKKIGDGYDFILMGSDPLRGSDPIRKEPLPHSLLIHDLDGRARWDTYLSEISDTLKNNLSVIILMPDIPDVLRARDLINGKLGVTASILYRKQPKEWQEWLNVRQDCSKIVIGTRSAVFAPLNNLGLLIIDSEEDFVYKQDQVPHYHAREVAAMRAKLEGFKLVLGSRSPSLESFYQADKKRIEYKLITRKKQYPAVKLIDSRHLPFQDRAKNALFSRQLSDSIYSVLNEKGRVLLFLNRKGFATTCACHNCGYVIRCPRCNVNLVYHFSKGLLSCNYCSFKMKPPEICPECNAGYIKFSGSGTEKIESEISRAFPQAKTSIIEERGIKAPDADITIATSAVIKEPGLDFDLVGVLGIDNVLNHVDFRSTEKAFALLAGLITLVKKEILIQTRAPEHHCFQALLKNDERLFYVKELTQRKQLSFPPYKHMIAVKLRSRLEDKAKNAAESLHDKLKTNIKDGSAEVISVNPSNPPKKRGNYYWQILLRTNKVLALSEFLKKNLKDFRHSGIIITVDVDPL